jgi:hypothetical protein
MNYDASGHDAVYQPATGHSTTRSIWRHPIVEVTEEWVKAQNTPANVDPDEDRWREEGALYLDRNVLERGEPARNGRTNGVFFLRHADAEAHL